MKRDLDEMVDNSVSPLPPKQKLDKEICKYVKAFIKYL